MAALIERVAAWPADAQSALIRAALAIDLDVAPPFELDADDEAALARSERDVAEGRFATDADIRRLFDRG